MSARFKSRLLGSHDIMKVKADIPWNTILTIWTKSSTQLIRRRQVPSRSPNLLSSQNFYFLRVKLTFEKDFENNLASVLKCGIIPKNGTRLSVWGSTVPGAFSRGNWTKDQSTALLCSTCQNHILIPKCTKNQACAMNFWKGIFENMMFASKIGKYLENKLFENCESWLRYCFWESENQFLKKYKDFVKIDFEKCDITLENLISLNSNFEIENIT